MASASRGPFGKTEITVAGVAVQIDVEKDLWINDINLDMSRVSGWMAFWGDVQASAQEELTSNDAHYRHWRAGISRTILAREEKIAEWKVKAEIEASTDFLKFKLKQAQLEKNILLARSQFDSYRQKASLLQSKGANMRANIEAPSASAGPSEPPTSSSIVADDEDDLEEDDDLGVDDDQEGDKSIVASDTRMARMKSSNYFKKDKK